MKTIEEKAKAYDEAVYRVKHFLTVIGISPDDEPVDVAKRMSEYIFPELVESEDERIRKELIYYFKENNAALAFRGISNECILAWFEKQGEQKSTIYHKFRPGDIIRHIKQGFTCKIDSVDTEYRVSECGLGTHLPFDAEDYYELVEQETVEWSEEDEKYFNILISLVNNPSTEGMFDYHKINKTAFNNWLKSLHPQKQWKPSEEQMKALKKAMYDLCGKDEHNVITGLYYELEQLKAL